MKQYFTNLYCDGCGAVIQSWNTASRSTDVSLQYVELPDGREGAHYCAVCAAKPLTTFFPLQGP